MPINTSRPRGTARFMQRVLTITAQQGAVQFRYPGAEDLFACAFVSRKSVTGMYRVACSMSFKFRLEVAALMSSIRGDPFERIYRSMQGRELNMIKALEYLFMLISHSRCCRIWRISSWSRRSIRTGSRREIVHSWGL